MSYLGHQIYIVNYLHYKETEMNTEKTLKQNMHYFKHEYISYATAFPPLNVFKIQVLEEDIKYTTRY